MFAQREQRYILRIIMSRIIRGGYGTAPILLQDTFSCRSRMSLPDSSVILNPNVGPNGYSAMLTEVNENRKLRLIVMSDNSVNMVGISSCRNILS